MSYAVQKIEARRTAAVKEYRADPSKMDDIIAKSKPEQAKARTREHDLAAGRTQVPNRAPVPTR